MVEQYQDLRDGTLLLCAPKSDAGLRTVAIPAILKPELEAHLATFSAPGKKGLVFSGTLDQPLRIATLHAAWKRAVKTVGIEGFRFHDHWPRRTRPGREARRLRADRESPRRRPADTA